MTQEDVESLVQRVLRMWRSAGLYVRPPDPRSAGRFQHRFGVTMPADAASYFFSHGGMPEGAWDANLIRFWSLDEVRPVSTLMPELRGPELDDYFLFADYSLWAHGYAVRISPSRRTDVIIVGGKQPISIAASLREFLAKYVSDPRSLF